MHQLLSAILEEKSGEVLQIDGGATVFEAITKMVDANVGSLLVTDDGEIVGIMTERDYLRRVTLQGRTDKETPVRDIMSSPLVVATPETSDRRVHGDDDRPPHPPPAGRGRRRGGGSGLDRRPREVPGEGAGLRDQVPDGLHHRRTRGG